MFRKLLYPFEAVVFILAIIFITILFCLDMMLSSVIMGICFAFKAYKVVIKISNHIEDVLEDVSFEINEISELSESILSKKRNKEKSNT